MLARARFELLEAECDCCNPTTLGGYNTHFNIKRLDRCPPSYGSESFIG